MLYQIKFKDGSYKQMEASSEKAIETLFGIENIHSIVTLEMRRL